MNKQDSNYNWEEDCEPFNTTSTSTYIILVLITLVFVSAIALIYI